MCIILFTCTYYNVLCTLYVQYFIIGIYIYIYRVPRRFLHYIICIHTHTLKTRPRILYTHNTRMNIVHLYHDCVRVDVFNPLDALCWCATSLSCPALPALPLRGSLEVIGHCDTIVLLKYRLSVTDRHCAVLYYS